eukprot:1634416-Amphidinium_carterae.1
MRVHRSCRLMLRAISERYLEKTSSCTLQYLDCFWHRQAAAEGVRALPFECHCSPAQRQKACEFAHMFTHVRALHDVDDHPVFHPKNHEKVQKAC